MTDDTTATDDDMQTTSDVLERLAGEGWIECDHFDSGMGVFPLIDGVHLGPGTLSRPIKTRKEGVESYAKHITKGYTVEIDRAFRHPENADFRVRVTAAKDE